jgi:hypothetical protein
MKIYEDKIIEICVRTFFNSVYVHDFLKICFANILSYLT